MEELTTDRLFTIAIVGFIGLAIRLSGEKKQGKKVFTPSNLVFCLSCSLGAMIGVSNVLSALGWEEWSWTAYLFASYLSTMIFSNLDEKFMSLTDYLIKKTTKNENDKKDK